MHDSCCFRVCTRAHDVINTEEILSQITKNPSLWFEHLVITIEQKQRKATKERSLDERRGCVLFILNIAKRWISWPETTESKRREKEQIEREIRTSLIPTSSSVCMCVPTREKESSVCYSSVFRSVEVEISSQHVVVRAGKG